MIVLQSTKHSIGKYHSPKNGVDIPDGVYFDSAYPDSQRGMIVEKGKFIWLYMKTIGTYVANTNSYTSDSEQGDKRFSQFAPGSVISFIQE